MVGRSGTTPTVVAHAGHGYLSIGPVVGVVSLFDRETLAAALPDRLDVRSLRLGAKGGFVATVAMTAFRMPISESLPPSAHFCAQYLGGEDPSQYRLLALGLHLLYGTVAGGLFAWWFTDRVASEPGRAESYGLLFGSIYGLISSVFGIHVVLDRLLGLDLAFDEIVIFHASHAIYGATLGAWVASEISHEKE
jgi:hypothetical protein